MKPGIKSFKMGLQIKSGNFSMCHLAGETTDVSNSGMTFPRSPAAGKGETYTRSS